MRESHGGERRIKTARFPVRKTLEEFDFTFQRSAKKQVIEHRGQLDFPHGKEDLVLLGRHGTGKTHLARAQLRRRTAGSPGESISDQRKAVSFRPALIRRGDFTRQDLARLMARLSEREPQLRLAA